MRKLLNPGYRQRAEFRPKVETFVEEMIDRLVEKGAAGAEIEFIDLFAYHLPATRR